MTLANGSHLAELVIWLGMRLAATHSSMTQNVLFICSQNRLRSPTAEQVFANWPGTATASGGLNRDAEIPVTPELLDWADIIFVMERAHRSKLSAKFKQHLHDKRVICLEIPDNYDFMAPELVELLKARVPRHLRSTEPAILAR